MVVEAANWKVSMVGHWNSRFSFYFEKYHSTHMQLYLSYSDVIQQINAIYDPAVRKS